MAVRFSTSTNKKTIKILMNFVFASTLIHNNGFGQVLVPSKKTQKIEPQIKSCRGESERYRGAEEALVSDLQKGHMHGGGADWSSARVSVSTLVLS